MCDCTEYVNSQLVKFGGRLAVGVRIDPKTMDVTGRLLLVTEKTDKSKREPPIVSASFCPFCGEKVVDAVATKAEAETSATATATASVAGLSAAAPWSKPMSVQETWAAAPAVERLTDEQVGQLEYAGNSVSFIHSKMRAYRTGIDDAWQAMREAGFPPDGNTRLSDAIRTALTTHREHPAAQQERQEVRKAAEEVKRLAGGEQPSKLPEDYIAQYLPNAKGATFFGVPLQELSRDDLMAGLIQAWTDLQDAQKRAREATTREFEALARLARGGRS
jgi:hypothetical protein